MCHHRVIPLCAHGWALSLSICREFPSVAWTGFTLCSNSSPVQGYWFLDGWCRLNWYSCLSAASLIFLILICASTIKLKHQLHSDKQTYCNQKVNSHKFGAKFKTEYHSCKVTCLGKLTWVDTLLQLNYSNLYNGGGENNISINHKATIATLMGNTPGRNE